MPHSHDNFHYKDCKIERITDTDQKFNYLVKTYVLCGEERFFLHVYKVGFPFQVGDVCDVLIYDMKHPDDENANCNWYITRMGYFIKSNKNASKPSKNTLLENQIMIITYMTSNGMPVCKPSSPVMGRPRINSGNGFNPLFFKNIISNKIMIPTYGFHDPKHANSHPNLGEEVFGFYILTEDTQKIGEYINEEGEFSYPGVIGYSREYGYYISI